MMPHCACDAVNVLYPPLPVLTTCGRRRWIGGADFWPLKFQRRRRRALAKASWRWPRRSVHAATIVWASRESYASAWRLSSRRAMTSRRSSCDWRHSSDGLKVPKGVSVHRILKRCFARRELHTSMRATRARVSPSHTRRVRLRERLYRSYRADPPPRGSNTLSAEIIYDPTTFANAPRSHNIISRDALCLPTRARTQVTLFRLSADYFPPRGVNTLFRRRYTIGLYHDYRPRA